MQIIIVIILVIAIIILLLGLLVSFLHFILISLPAWGGTVVVVMSIFFMYRTYLLHRLNSPEKLAKFITVSFNGERLNWSLNESLIGKCANIGLPVFLGILSGAIFIYLIQNALYKSGTYQNFTFFDAKVPPKVSIILGYILTGIVIIIIITKSKPREFLKHSIRNKINYLMSKINLQINRIDELKSLEASIKSISSSMNIPFPISFRKEVYEFIDIHKDKLLSNTIEIDKLITRNIKQAQEDKIRLEKAHNLYMATMELYTQTSREVNRTGLMPLIKELDFNYKGLISENIKSALLNREWEDFNYGLNAIANDIKRLNELAIRSQQEGYKKETESYKKEKDEDKAYRILNVPPTTSNEKIKKAYYTLSSIWHPDVQEEKDDTRFKELNWAYHFLKEKRKFK